MKTRRGSSTRRTRAAELPLLAAMVALLLWSAGNLIVRGAPLGGVQIAFWRLVAGAAIYFTIFTLLGRRIRWTAVKATVVPAVTIALEIAVFFVAIKRTTVANATVIAALQPLLLFGVASRRFGERITTTLLAAAAVALGGVALVVYGSSSEATWSLGGDVLAFIAVFLFAAYFASVKEARMTVGVFELQTISLLIGSVILLPIALIDARGLDVPTSSEWLWVLMLVAVPGTGHLLMNWAHSGVALSVSSMLTLALPVLSTIGAAIFFDEAIVIVQVVGMALVLVALAVVIRQHAELASD